MPDTSDTGLCNTLTPTLLRRTLLRQPQLALLAAECQIPCTIELQSGQQGKLVISLVQVIVLLAGRNGATSGIYFLLIARLKVVTMPRSFVRTRIDPQTLNGRHRP
jgi:hypothetical protein